MDASKYFARDCVHTYLQLQTHAVGNDARHHGAHKGTHYKCLHCQFEFVHWYDQVRDINEAERLAGAPTVCNKENIKLHETFTCLVCSAAAAAAVSTNQMSSSEMHGDDRKRSYALAPREAEHLIFNRMGASHNDAEYLIENQMSASRSDAEEERMCGDYCPL